MNEFPERTLAAIGRIARAMARPAEYERLLRVIAEEAAPLLDTDSAVLCISEPEEDILRVRSGTGLLAAHEGELLPIEGSFAGFALRSGRPQRTEDAMADPRVYRPRERGLRIGPLLAAPLIGEHGAAGVLLVARPPGAGGFAEADVAAVRPLAEVAAAAIENARAFVTARGSRAELEAWRREARLLRWIERYETVAETDRKVVWEWNPSTDRLDWGGSLSEVFGYTPDKIGRTLNRWAEHLHPEDRDRVVREVQVVAEHGISARQECRLRDGAGEYRRIVVRAGQSPEGVGENNVLGVLDDIAGQQSNLEDRDRSVRSQAIGELIRGLRHEINNPLAVVMGQAQLLLSEAAIGEDPLLQQSVQAIHEESARMEELLKRLASVNGSAGEPFLNPAGGIHFPERPKPRRAKGEG